MSALGRIATVAFGQKRACDVLEHQHNIAGFICEDFALEVPASNIGKQRGA
jgi:hypothetical protein